MGESYVTDERRLRRVAEPVLFDAKTRIYARRVMQAGTRAREIRGLAAPQIGLPYRLFHYNFIAIPDVDDSGVPADRGGLTAVGVVCNPAVVSQSDETWDRFEQCLSMPGQRCMVRRPCTVEFEWFTAAGEQRSTTLSGMPARVWLHELDHLDGVLMSDRAVPT